MTEWFDQLRWDEHGLVAAVAQDAKSGRVLTVAWMNQASHTLSPRPRNPIRFIPSFQSPPAISGSPCGPSLKPRLKARRQCSSSDARSGATANSA